MRPSQVSAAAAARCSHLLRVVPSSDEHRAARGAPLRSLPAALASMETADRSEPGAGNGESTDPSERAAPGLQVMLMDRWPAPAASSAARSRAGHMSGSMLAPAGKGFAMHVRRAPALLPSIALSFCRRSSSRCAQAWCRHMPSSPSRPSSLAPQSCTTSAAVIRAVAAAARQPPPPAHHRRCRRLPPGAAAACKRKTQGSRSTMAAALPRSLDTHSSGGDERVVAAAAER